MKLRCVIQPTAIVALMLLCTLQGYLTGRLVDIVQDQADAQYLQLVPDVNTGRPVVHITELRDGLIQGTASSGLTLFIGDEQAKIASGSFTVAAGPLLVHKQTVIVPPGMKFVASRQGSKYYQIGSASGDRIKPANRIYFAAAEAAEQAGYRP